MIGHNRNTWSAWSSSTTTESKSNTLAASFSNEESNIEDWQASGTAPGTLALDEKTPLLAQQSPMNPSSARSSFTVTSIPRRIAEAIIGACKLLLSAALAPGRFVVACFYDDKGNFSATMPFRKLGRTLSRTPNEKDLHSSVNGAGTKNARSSAGSGRMLLQNASDAEKTAALSSAIETDSESSPPSSPTEDSPAKNTRSKSPPNPLAEDSDTEPKKGPRVKIVNQEALRRRRQHRHNPPSPLSSSQEPALTMATLKSPTSNSPTAPAYKLTRYPRHPAPPRPLIPRRQPSYTATNPTPNPELKTLVIDLDETLIHSMAKGGRMSTGHMVEVKLSSPIGVGGNIIGPQVPILYYVHKRPHCDEFLRKVSKWYNLIVFTASVQEYADPVIDWLELERKYFSARYYRQHCTYRNGAYIKDLSQVEPDLSKIMILDNSPMSYIFHEDNAVPIEGWISDPTDNDLLHLIPLFEGLQHAVDVRSLLALRLGESVS